jgi:RNA-directed DNA polymerase
MFSRGYVPRVCALAGLAEWINPVARGWMSYYGRFGRSRLYRLLQRINTYIVR